MHQRFEEVRVLAGLCNLAFINIPIYRYRYLRIGSLALPLMVQNVAGYLITLTCAISVGCLGAPEHAAATLANSVYIITGLSLVTGLESAMETLCGQAYGAGDFSAVGELLQRALLICWTACLPVAALWSHAPALLSALGQKPEIASAAGQ